MMYEKTMIGGYKNCEWKRRINTQYVDFAIYSNLRNHLSMLFFSMLLHHTSFFTMQTIVSHVMYTNKYSAEYKSTNYKLIYTFRELLNKYYFIQININKVSKVCSWIMIFIVGQ